MSQLIERPASRLRRLAAAIDDAVAGRSTDEAVLLAVAIAFVGVNSFVLTLVRGGRTPLDHLWAPAVWAMTMTGAHALLTRYRPRRDPFLLPIYALLTGWGLLLLDRLAANFLTRQVIWLFLATAVMLAIAIWPRNLRFLRRYRYTWLSLGLVLLAATLAFGVNPSGAGAALWLPMPLLGNVFFQPSELLKLLLVVFLASYFDERQQLLALSRGRGRFGRLPYLAPLLLMWGFCVLLLTWQRDLGAATLFFILFLALLYLATGDGRYVAGGILLLLLAGAIGFVAFAVVEQRVITWWNPWPFAGDRGFQIVQSLYALAAGGILGQGLAQGAPDFIPVVHSDFVFAAIAEEFGLVGAIVLVSVLLVLFYRGWRIAAMVQRPFRMYLAAGITVLMATQSLLIMGGVTRLLPLTGVTLPLVSYGGSSLLITSIMIGLLMHLSATANVPWESEFEA